MSEGRLPDFLIAGFQKCGTTSLFNALCQHPDIAGPAHPPAEKKVAGLFPKELAYFGANYRFGITWYRQRFDSASPVTFEATPYYTADPRCMERMASCLPDIRLIFLLRDPVERAFSAWNHWLQLSPDMRRRWLLPDPGGTFASNVDAELNGGNRSTFWGLAGMGVYAPQLENVFRHYPRERVLILFTKDLQQDPAGVINRIQDFLKVGRHPISIPTDHQREYDRAMDKTTFSVLKDFYRPWDERLEQLLGRPLPWAETGFKDPPDLDGCLPLPQPEPS